VQPSAPITQGSAQVRCSASAPHTDVRGRPGQHCSVWMPATADFTMAQSRSAGQVSKRRVHSHKSQVTSATYCHTKGFSYCAGLMLTHFDCAIATTEMDFIIQMSHNYIQMNCYFYNYITVITIQTVSRKT